VVYRPGVCLDHDITPARSERGARIGIALDTCHRLEACSRQAEVSTTSARE
jgi:uncharacterized ParB-like nuclease family protein